MNIPVFKRIIQSFILILLVITIMPIRQISADEYIAYGVDSSGNKIANYTNIDDAIKATRENGYKIVMTKDWEISSPINIVEGTSATIEMNGYRIKKNGTGEIFILHPSSTLNLYGELKPNTLFRFFDNTNGVKEGQVESGGLVTNGKISGNKSGTIYLKKKATLNLKSVAIAGNYGSSNGAAIYVDGSNCNINLDNSKINYNKANTGAGICSDDDNTAIYLENKSEINFNITSHIGSAVYFSHSYYGLISKDKTGQICYNTSNMGTVYAGEKSGEIRNLTISYNIGNLCAGIYLRSSGGLIDGCTITYNTASMSAGGINFAGDGILKDSVVTNNTCNTNYKTNHNNNDGGGGVAVTDLVDISLVGKVIIKDNKRINGSEKGYTEDDLCLTTSKAYIKANSISSDSIVGIRSSESGDQRLVKNLYNFEYGHVFFLDLADRLHLGYESSDKELWQRPGKVQYSVYVNGKEVGRYDYNDSVTVDASKILSESKLAYWSKYEGLDLTDSQIKSSTLTFKMPARDVVLKAVLAAKEATGVTVIADAPILGKALNNEVKVNLMIGGTTYKTITTKVMWQKKNSDGSYSDLGSGYIVKENETYRVRAGFTKDDAQLVAYSKDITEKDVKVIYEVNGLQKADYAYWATGDEYHNLDFQGPDIETVNQILSVKDYVQTLTVGVGTSFHDLYYNMLPQTIETTDVLTGETYTFSVDAYKVDMLNELREKGLLDENDNVKKTKSEYITTSLKIDDRYDYNFLVKEILIKIYVKDAVTNVDNTTIMAYQDDSPKTIIDQIPSTISATTSTNQEVTVGVNVPSYDELVAKFKEAGIVKNLQGYDYVSNHDTSIYTLKLDTYPLDDNLICDKQASFEIIINSVKINFLPNLNLGSGSYTYPSSLFSLASENDVTPSLDNTNTPEYDENGNLIIRVTNYSEDIKDDGVELTYSIDDGDEKTYNVEDKIALTVNENQVTTHKLAISVKQEDDVKYYVYTYIINKNGSYINLLSPSATIESGVYNTNSLDVDLLCENEDAKIKYIKYYDDESGLAQNEETYESSISLTADSGSYTAYAIETWSELNGVSSDHKFYFYELDNTNTCNVTVNIKSDDGKIKETKNFVIEESGYIVLPEIDGYTLWGDAKLTKGDATNVYDQTKNINDRYTYKVNSADKDIVLDAAYKAVVNYLNIEMDDLTPGNSLPQIKSISGILSDGNTTVDLTAFYNLNDVKWSINSSDVDSSLAVDYDTNYDLYLPSSGISNPYLFTDIESNISDNDKGYVIASSLDNSFISIYFNKTKTNTLDNQLNFDLIDISSVNYSDITHEQALLYNEAKEGYTILDNYNLPSKIDVNYKDGTSDLLNIIWNNNFTTSFNPNNYDSQELVIEGYVKIPSYVKNTNGISNKVTLKIKVKAKQGYIPQEVIDNSSNKAVTCEEYMKSKDWTWSESKKACVYKVSNTGTSK